MSIQTIEDRLLEFIASGEEFSADDVTDLGKYHLGDVSPNGPQSSIGTLFRTYSRRGLIEPVGWASSRSPRRRGGGLRTWRGVKPDE